MDSKGYWINRQAAKYLAGEKLVNDYYKELERAFKQAKKEIHNVVNEFYIRYANENNLSFIEAQKALSKAEIGELKEFIEMVNEYMGTYNLELNNMSVKARITRYQALEKQIDAILQRLYSAEYEYKGKQMLSNVYGDSYYRTWWNIDCYNGFHSSFAQVNTSLIEELISYPFNGANYSSRLWKQKDHMLYKLKESLTTMMIQGKNPRVLAPAFAKQFDVKTKDAYRLLHTEGSFIIEQATQKAYQEDGVQKYQWSSTLDLKTCSDCGPLDGELFDVGKGIVGETLPPKHNRCRCTTTPYFGEEYKSTTRAARNPFTGKSISIKNMSYKEWYKEYVESNPEVKLAEKKLKNLTNDKKQYANYKYIFGNNIPKSLDEFQELKYTDSKQWERLKSNYRYANMLNKKKTVILNETNRSLPLEGKPNSITDLVEMGNTKQRRIYGDDRKVIKDIDTSNHNKPKYHPMGAHKHEYDYNNRNPHGKADYFTEEELEQNKDIIKKGVNYNDDRNK